MANSQFPRRYSKSVQKQFNVRLRVEQWLFLAASLLILGSVISWDLYSDYNRIGAQEREQMSAHAKVINDNLSQQLGTTSFTLEAIRRDLPAYMAQKDWQPNVNRYLQSLIGAMSGVRALFIVNADGVTIASNRADIMGANFREREYFKAPQRTLDPAALHVSPPYRNINNVFTMSLSKAILNERGEFAGVAVATLSPAFFSTLLDSIIYAPDMRTAIIHGNGTMFLTSPSIPGVDGMDLAKPGTFFTRHRKSGQPASLFTGMATATGDERVMALRTVQPTALRMDNPFVVAVSRDLSSIHADWRREAYAKGGLFGLLVLIATLGLILYQRRQLANDRMIAEEEAARQKAEEDLRMSEARFRSLTEMSSDFYWETDVEHRLTIRTESKRESAEGVFLQESPIGKRRWEAPYLFPDEQGWQKHRAALDAHFPFRDFEVTRPRANGTVHHVSVSGDPVFDASGKFMGYRGVGADITERNRAEAEIRRINTELERHVQQRTRELQVANSELESFAYTVSHDLRTPLRAIEGFSRLLESEYSAQLDERGKDYFRRIRGGATRMANLIDDLLKLSRISRQKMDRESVDLSAIVRDAAEDLRGAEPERLVEWVIAPQVTVRGDRGLLQVAVQNLIANAWKYSSKRDAARIEFGTVERNGKPAYFVRDNGAGFDMAYANKLFEAFQRLHSPDEFPGTGIGLATVKRIIHRHGGEVSAESKLGGGATFYFTL